MGEIDSMTRSDLLEIIDDRAANKATIITSQLPVEHWHAWIGDATIADAILDRIMQRNHRFTLTGDSWMNQIEIWFGILSRKVVKRGNFRSKEELRDKLMAFIDYFNKTLAKPFRWTYQGKPLVA